MNTGKIRALVKTYVGEKYPRNIEQTEKRILQAIEILEQNGIIIPTEADFENILKPAIAAKGKKKGEPAQPRVISDRLSLLKKFYNWCQSKGDFQMNDNEFSNTEEKMTNFPAETSQTAVNEAKHEQEPPKRGKPVTNGRSEKVSLYMTKETFNRLDDLRKYDETNLQDLINEALEVYFKTREDDIKFLQEQEKARRARKAQKARK